MGGIKNIDITVMLSVKLKEIDFTKRDTWWFFNDLMPQRLLELKMKNGEVEGLYRIEKTGKRKLAAENIGDILAYLVDERLLHIQKGDVVRSTTMAVTFEAVDLEILQVGGTSCQCVKGEKEELYRLENVQLWGQSTFIK